MHAINKIGAAARGAWSCSLAQDPVLQRFVHKAGRGGRVGQVFLHLRGVATVVAAA